MLEKRIDYGMENNHYPRMILTQNTENFLSVHFMKERHNFSKGRGR